MMEDFLRILTRGVKKPKQSAKYVASSQAIHPSAGAKPNPQLFGDNAGTQAGKKRKRAEDDEPWASKVFAPKAVGEDMQRDSIGPSNSDLLNLDDCRRLLRSHRLKFTLFSNGHGRKHVSPKANKRIIAVETKPKDDKIQLYPQPLKSFAELRSAYDVPNQIYENLKKEGYGLPTEVQLGSLPLLLRPEVALQNADDPELEGGLDFMTVAPSGSGKTVSYLIPAITSIVRRRTKNKPSVTHELEALIVAPTNELAFQIMWEARKLAAGTGLEVAMMRKGMRFAAEPGEAVQGNASALDESEEDEPSESAGETEVEDSEPRNRSAPQMDILITTPMLMFNAITTKSPTVRKALSTVRTLIMDEADAVLDGAMRKQTMVIWSACSNPSLRTTFWSATMGSKVEALIPETLAERAERLGINTAPLVRLVVGLSNTAVPNINHMVISCGNDHGKRLAVHELLNGGAPGPTLPVPFMVFTESVNKATHLREELEHDIHLSAGGSSRVATFHGGLSDSERARIMRRFRAGEIWVLITTDILSRGIDFAGVNAVVNYDVPTSTAQYVNRVGRTGRVGREGGVAVTLYGHGEVPILRTVANVIMASEKQAGKSDTSFPKALYDALPKVSDKNRKLVQQRQQTAKNTLKSGWERRKDHNRRAAIEGSRQRKKLQGRQGDDVDEEWGGFED
jgi:ATP-dependent RNA helicase DDX52/ROK1